MQSVRRFVEQQEEDARREYKQRLAVEEQRQERLTTERERERREEERMNGDCEDDYRPGHPQHGYLVKVYEDGPMWCALIGEDIQSGTAGFSTTPAEALRMLANAMEAEGGKPEESGRS